MADFDKFISQRKAQRQARKSRSEKRKERLLKHGMPLFKKYGIKTDAKTFSVRLRNSLKTTSDHGTGIGTCSSA
jgi:hypothetical protein